MNVFFVGQTSVLGQSKRERRMQALAKQLAMQNHVVTAYSAIERHIRRTNGLHLRYTPSFLPDTPGGWLYTLISFLRALKKTTDVIHLHGWKVAALLPLAALVRPEVTYVWTVDTLPENYRIARRMIVWFAARLCDAITVPTRDIQYKLRLTYRVLAVYVPDGYSAPAMKDIPASHWKLRKGQYTLVVGDDIQMLRTMCLAYKETGSRKKLTVLVNEITPTLTRLARRYSFVRLIESTSTRQRSSLIRQAQRVVLLDPISHECLLVMDAEVPLLAVNHPILQEIAGTTVQFLSPHDRKHLSELLKNHSTEDGRKAKIRARAHFAWSRIFQEYETFYHYPRVVRVPVDSVRGSRLVHGEVY